MFLWATVLVAYLWAVCIPETAGSSKTCWEIEHRAEKSSQPTRARNRPVAGVIEQGEARTERSSPAEGANYISQIFGDIIQFCIVVKTD